MSLFSSFGNALFGVPQQSTAPIDADAEAARAAAAAYGSREQSDYNNEAGLADNLQKTVNGTGGPSVAQTQLRQTLSQNLASGLAMGSGSTGTNSVLARYLAAQQTGNAGAAAAEAGAVARAQEIANAQKNLAGLYSDMGSRSAGLFGTSTNTGLGYSNLGANVAQNNAANDQKSEAAGLQFLSGMGSMYFGKPPSGIGGGMSPSAYGAGYSAAQPGYVASGTAGL
jgi:hypothetical protein